MNAIGRYALLTLRVFVKQEWSVRRLLLSGLALPAILFLDREVVNAQGWTKGLQPLLLSMVSGVGCLCGLSLRRRFFLPITPRVRWMGGLVASGVAGLTLFGTLHGLGLTLFGEWSFVSFARPVGIALLAYLPWAGFAFLGGDGAVATVLLAVIWLFGLWMTALVRLEPDVHALSLWSGLLLSGAFLVAPRLEHARGSRRPGYLRQGMAGSREWWSPLPALGASPLPPFRAWERVLQRRFVQLWAPLAFMAVLLNVMGAYWTTDPGDSVQAELFESLSTTLTIAIFTSIGIPMAVQGVASFSPVPAALLPLPARSFWWGTLLGAIPLALLMIAATLVSGIIAARLVGEPLNPTLYEAFLASSPILVAFALLLRASWPLGFLLATPQRTLSKVFAFLGYTGSVAASIWHPSFVLSLFALAGSIGVLGLIAPRRYRSPA